MAAGWYGSLSLVRQVLECEKHEKSYQSTRVNSYSNKYSTYKCTCLEFRDELCGNIVNIFELLQTLRLSLESNDTDQFKNTWVSLNTKFEELHLDD